MLFPSIIPARIMLFPEQRRYRDFPTAGCEILIATSGIRHFIHKLVEVEKTRNGDISSRKFVTNVFMLNYFI